MGFRKYQKAEQIEVVASADAPETLRKFGVVDDVVCTNIECVGGCSICSQDETENVTDL